MKVLGGAVVGYLVKLLDDVIRSQRDRRARRQAQQLELVLKLHRSVYEMVHNAMDRVDDAEGGKEWGDAIPDALWERERVARPAVVVDQVLVDDPELRQLTWRLVEMTYDTITAESPEACMTASEELVDTHHAFMKRVAVLVRELR